MTRARRVLPWLVGALALVPFLPALDGQFLNWDDDVNFVHNHGFRGLGWAQIRWMWSTTLMGHYIPLTWMTLGLNYALGGMSPWGYHLGNLLLHGANTALVYLVARRLLSAGGIPPGTALEAGSTFAALLFAVHPLRVESVAWITERRDVLCGLFFFLSVLAYLVWVQDGGGRARWRLASVAAFAAALLSKAQAMPLPVGLLIADVYPLRRARQLGWRALIAEKIPYLALSLAAAVVALLAVQQGARFTSYGQYGPLARVAMTAYGIVFFPWKWLWPSGLSPLYELPPRLDPLAARFLVPMVALVAVTALLVALRHRWPAGLAAWLFSAVMVLPVVGPVHAGGQLAHDRYSYLSGLGLAVMAGGALGGLLSAGARGAVRPLVARAGAAAAALILVALGSASWGQAGAWRDSASLWAWAVDVDPECVTCLNSLGVALGPRTRPREAEGALRRALALRDLAESRNNLGLALDAQGRAQEAEAEYREALRQDPRLVGALGNLGALHATAGRLDEAIPLFRQALALAPDLPGMRATLDRALRERSAELARAGRTLESEALLREAQARAAPASSTR
jgi:tetratricopeptide (TPR) repeat protein